MSTPLTLETINPKLLLADYAVRGALSRLAEKIRGELAGGSTEYPFTSIVPANLGNPQGLAQKPITFIRQVQALLHYPALLESIDRSSTLQTLFPEDVVERARWLLDSIKSVGAYSSNQGVLQVRESVAQYISERDGFPSDPDNVFLTCGAFEGMLIAMFLLAGGENRGEKSGVMLSVPQYPVYVALLKMLDLHHIPYLLDEEKGWKLPDNQYLQARIDEAKSSGIIPRCIVIINPSNPTGSLLSADDIASLIDVAAAEDLLILADEVYQSNIFPPGEFHSVKAVLETLRAKDDKYAKVQLISLHSVSKGIVGEGGQRGGYFETFNLPDDVSAQLKKLVSFMLQPATPGQIVLECMVNPPKEQQSSYGVYAKEAKQISGRLEDIATRLYHAFTRMPGVTCQKPQGALYLFPRVDIPNHILAEAAKEGMESEVDVWFCMRLLKETGVCVVPGSGFGKVPTKREDGKVSIWFRITFLAEGEAWIEQIANFFERFMK